MHDTTELRDGLVELAEPVIPVEDYEDRVMRRARRLRGRRRFVTGAAAAVCLAVLVTMFRVVGIGSAPYLAAVPPDGPFLGWAPVGDVDAGLVREANDVWDRAGSGGPHTGVSTLVATRDVQLHSVVVLQGYDNQGDARLAFFTSDQSAANDLRLRVDRPAPDPVTTQVISLVGPTLTGPTGEVSKDGWGSYAIAVAMPGVTAVRIWSTAIDEQMVGEPDAPTSRLAVQSLPLAGTAQTTTIAGFVKPNRPFASAKKVFEVGGAGGAAGDVQAVPGRVVKTTQHQAVVAFPNDRTVQPGQLAVVTQGLVGRVTAVDVSRSEATIELVTSTEFTGDVYTNISNVPGSVRGTGKSLIMERIPTDGEVNSGNRVMMPDPCQPNNQVGAVTIGRAASDKAAGAGSVELAPTADLTGLREVSIITAPAGGNC